ncbi:MAG: ATP-dependent DNA helicase RecG [Leptospirillum sp.]
MLTPATPVSSLPDVGPRRGERLSKLGIRTVLDLLYTLPFRYEDRRGVPSIENLREGEPQGFLATVSSIRKKEIRKLRVPVIEAILSDGSGSIKAVWFGQEYILKALPESAHAFFFGRIEYSEFDRAIVLKSPVFEKVDPGQKGRKSFHVNRIVPVYRESLGLTSSFFRKLMGETLLSLWGSEFDPLPESIRKKYAFVSWLKMMVGLHFPADIPPGGSLESLLDPSYPPRMRLIYEEFFLLEFLMFQKKSDIRAQGRPNRYRIASADFAHFTASLPFHLTNAQKKVMGEISKDLENDYPMNRLLLGDVGSGKTVVAAWALYLAIKSGFQCALMAPTEILAKQHEKTLSHLFSPLGLSPSLLTNSVKGAERKAIVSGVHSGQISLLVGTQALIQESLNFSCLGLVVIDEQHRFGVDQRRTLMGKGAQPDTLLMTATPIPRSLALSYYGDMDLSVLDEKPPGRLPVKTRISRSDSDFWDRTVRPFLERGEQVFVVCPLIEESDVIEAKDASSHWEFLSTHFSPVEVGLLTGRTPAESRENMMSRFRSGKILMLVSTTVIEVGVDIPNATVMVVESAERFGLAQLHQLRGRVGRGALPGFFFLIPGEGASDEAIARLHVLEASDDGFFVAEEDLRSRGPGEFLGTRQSGAPAFICADLLRDFDTLQSVRMDVQSFLQEGEAQSTDHQKWVWAWTTVTDFIRSRYTGVEEWIQIR